VRRRTRGVPVPRAFAGAVASASLVPVVCALAACALPRGGTGRLDTRADVAGAPLAVVTPSGTHTAYEVEVRNQGETAVRIERLVRRRSDLAGEETFDRDRLARCAIPRRGVKVLSECLDLPPGERAVLLLDAAGGAAAPSFEHDLVLSGAGASGRAVEETITASDLATSAAPPLVLGPPLAGGGWVCENGPATLSGHRRAVVWLRGAPRAAQRFAVDFFRADDAGRTWTGDRRVNASHFAFDAEVLAVADARVAVAVDGIPDNTPDPQERAVEMSRGTVAGNHVVLDLGGGRFAMYAHLRQGTVAVREGDLVRRGRVLARLGNSGNSTEPHLHFHVADGPSPVDASGLPFVFDAFDAGGAQLAGVLPAEGSTVRFLENHATSGVPNASAPR
jgi:hypothetical protein